MFLIISPSQIRPKLIIKINIKLGLTQPINLSIQDIRSDLSLSLPSQEIPTKMGFFTPSLMNHLRLNAFKRPRLSTLLCSALSLSFSYFVSQFVMVNFLGHSDFLGLCSCRSFGFRLISIPLCYTQFRNIWKLQIVKNLILWKAMTTQLGFEHSYFSSATICDSAPRA